MTNLSDYFDKGNFYDTSDANITVDDLAVGKIGYGPLGRLEGILTLKTDLVSWWDADEASGQTRVDSHASNDVIDNNTVGNVGGYAHFTHASNQFLSKNTPTNLYGGDRDWTMAAWVNMDTIGGFYGVFNNAVAGSVVAGSTDYMLVTSGGQFNLYLGVGGVWKIATASTFGALSTGTDYFVVATHDASAKSISIGVNGGTMDSTIYTGTANQVGTDFRIGNYGSASTYAWDGGIGPGAFWDAVLDPTQITQLYNSGVRLKYVDL